MCARGEGINKNDAEAVKWFATPPLVFGVPMKTIPHLSYRARLAKTKREQLAKTKQDLVEKYSALSPDELENHLKASLERYQALKPNLDTSDSSEAKDLEKRVNEIRNEIRGFQSERVAASNQRPTKFFGLLKSNEATMAEYILAEKMKRTKELLEPLETRLEQSRSREREIRLKQYEAERIKSDERKRLVHEISVLRLLKKKHKVRSVAAKVSAFYGNLRVTAPAVRRALMVQANSIHCCPYCNRSVTQADLVADHIYPVANGGLSTFENMVLICTVCNGRKGKRTLRAFCKNEGLEYERVCIELERLGKAI